MLTTFNETEHTVEVATDAGFTKPMAHWSFPQRYEHTYTIELAEFCAMLQQSPVVHRSKTHLITFTFTRT